MARRASVERGLCLAFVMMLYTPVPMMLHSLDTKMIACLMHIDLSTSQSLESPRHDSSALTAVALPAPVTKTQLITSQDPACATVLAHVTPFRTSRTSVQGS